MEQDLPKGWEWISIEDLAEKIIDYRGKTPNKSSSGIPLITAKVIRDGQLQNITEFISEEEYTIWMKRGFPQKNDVLFTTEGPLGEVALLDIDEKIALAQRVLLIRGKSEILDNSYLKEALRSELVKSQIEKYSTGSTVKGIRQSEFRKVKIPIPPLDTQQQIVTILKKAETIRRLRGESDKLTQKMLQNVFLEMFGDPVNNPMGWDVKKLENIISKSPSNGFFAKNDKYGVGNTRVIWISDFINQTYASTINLKQINVTNNEIIKYHVKYGDLLFCRSSLNFDGIGKASCVPKDIPANTIFECHIIKLTLDLNLAIPEFIQIQTTFPFFRDQIVSSANTATMTTISQSGISKCKVIIPPLILQKRFVEIVNINSNKIALSQRCMDQISSLNNNLMSRAFTGELIT